MGIDLFSNIILEGIIEAGYEVALVVTKCKDDTMPMVIKTAIKYGIPYIRPQTVKTEIPKIIEMKPDLIITASYGEMIPKSLLEQNIINIHGSLLPKYRGASPVQSALLNGDKSSGVTIQRMAFKMDTGPIIAKKKVMIDDVDNYSRLLTKIANAGLNLLIKRMKSLLSGNYKTKPQNELKATYTQKISAHDELVSFKNTKENIINKIRALNYNPGAYILINNIKIKVYEVQISDIMYKQSNLIVAIKDELIISCINGSVIIKRLQLPGKKVLDIKDFLNGQRILKIGMEVF